MTEYGVPALPPQMPAYPPPQTTPVPGRVMGIVGFVFSFFVLLNLAGLVLCIVALFQSRRAGARNGLAIAGIIVAAAGIALGIVIAIFAVPVFVNAAQTCARLGTGVHVIGNSTYTCTPTSFNVSSHL